MDFDVYLRFMLALILVLGLIAGLTWAARRFGFGGQLIPNAGKSPRLSVVEVRTLDSRRKLVLLRRDGSEHLVLLGPNQDLLLEGGISAPSEATHPVSLAATGAGAGAPKITETPKTTENEPAPGALSKMPTTERRHS
jgi:flagellar protein FliO/FliZ